MAILNLSAPWIDYYRKINALFGDDPEINVIYDDAAREVKLYVDDAAKADAIAQILPAEKPFGDVTVKVTVFPSNRKLTASRKSLFEVAFDGNPACAYIASVSDIFELTYVVFEPVVVQYWDDNLADPHGLVSTLYQDIAKEIIPMEGVYYCTDRSELEIVARKQVASKLQASCK